MRTLNPTRTPEYRIVMTVISVGCGLAVLGSVVPVVDQVVNLGLLGLGVLAVLVLVSRWLARFVRERIEDRADVRTAAAWRAAHCTRAPTPTPAGVS